MTHDDEVCLKLGREIVRMIRDLRKVAQNEPGYSRRQFTFPGGAVNLFLVNEVELADRIEKFVEGKYAIQEATPPSQEN